MTQRLQYTSTLNLSLLTVNIIVYGSLPKITFRVITYYKFSNKHGELNGNVTMTTEVGTDVATS